MKIKIEITETLQKTIEIEADNVSDAISKVKNLYRKEDILLDSNDYVSTEIKVVE